MTSRRRTAATAMAIASVLALLTGCTAGSPSADSAPATDGSGHDVGVELFQWTWNSIARECTEQLGPAGYSWVLTSPPQDCARSRMPVTP